MSPFIVLCPFEHHTKEEIICEYCGGICNSICDKKECDFYKKYTKMIFTQV